MATAMRHILALLWAKLGRFRGASRGDEALGKLWAASRTGWLCIFCGRSLKAAILGELSEALPHRDVEDMIDNDSDARSRSALYADM